jgi:hypothetical protein
MMGDFMSVISLIVSSLHAATNLGNLESVEFIIKH